MERQLREREEVEGSESRRGGWTLRPAVLEEERTLRAERMAEEEKDMGDGDRGSLKTERRGGDGRWLGKNETEGREGKGEKVSSARGRRHT